MTPKITKQFLDLAQRFANHGHKHNFTSGFTKIKTKDTNLEVNVYFSDFTKKDWSITFSMVNEYSKKIEVTNFSKSITFGYLMKTSEFNYIIEESTRKILELESIEFIVDEENEKIKSKINELQGQLHDLTKQLKS
jgi:hypothetical protein